MSDKDHCQGSSPDLMKACRQNLEEPETPENDFKHEDKIMSDKMPNGLLDEVIPTTTDDEKDPAINLNNDSRFFGMNQVTLPPSPNWYLTTIMSCSKDSTVAWGSKNMIVVSHPRTIDGKSYQYSIIPDAHTDRVTSVSFCPDYGADRRFLLSGGDHNIIKIWNIDTLTVIQSQSYSDSKQKVIGVDWSLSDPTHVCSVSVEGIIISWHINFTACETIKFEKMIATCIKFCNHKSNIVAVGSKAGLVYIINLKGSGTIMYKLRGHDTEITSLSWCPTSVNIFKENNLEDLLLASGAKDKSVFIWRAGRDGRYESHLTLPNAPQDSHQHRGKLSGVGYFTSLCWLEPKCLLVSSPFGELLAMDLGTTKNSWRLIHGDHSRGLFSIAAVPSSVDNQHQDNWRKSSRIVWTSAQDRQLVCSRIEGNQCFIEHSVPTQGGFIYCLAACPLETSLIAYGAGDNTLRLWNLTEPHQNSIKVTSLWQKIIGRVSAIAWHPNEENLLAFGTSEGRVGVFDTNNPHKSPVLCRQHHRRTVYSLAWGPQLGSTKYGLYSCADNELVCFNLEKVTKEPQIIVDKECTEFAWKPNFNCIAIGLEDGSISFKDRELKACGKPIFILKKSVQCIAWHPDSTLTDLEFSPMRNYMAVSTNTNKITIFDMTIMIDELLNNSKNYEKNGDEENNDKNSVMYKVVGTLNGHSDRVISLAWNPHISGQLVSGGHDCFAQVWSIESQEIIATFTGHCGPIYSCLWSPIDPDLIITGSRDFSLRVWRVSSQQVILPVTDEVKKSKNKKKKSKIGRVGAKENETNGIGTTNESVETLTSNIDKLSVKLEVKPKEKKTKKTFMPVYRKNMNNRDVALANCLKLARKYNNLENQSSDNVDAEDDDNDDVITIFGSKEEVMSVIKNEQATFTSQGHHIMAAEVSLWTGDLKEQLQTAAKERRLNDFMVSLAPMLSIKVWKEMCEAYAIQLELESNVTKAVAYFLIIHKVYHAIDVFMNAKMYQDAYTLARCRLDAEDKKLKEILEVWEKYAVKSGLYEEAAQCCILQKDCVKAAKFLAKRKDFINLKTAAEIAQVAGDFELVESLADQAVVQCLLQSNYSSARDVIKQFPIVEYRLIHLVALEEINKVKMKIDDEFVCSWLEDKTEDLISVLEGNYKYLNCPEAYGKLLNITYPDVPTNESNLWLSVSHNLALFASDNQHQMHHIVSTLGIITQYELTNHKSNSHISYLLSVLTMFPLHPNFDNDQPIYKSYRAYLCLALTSWLVDRITITKSPENLYVNKIVDVIKKCAKDALDPEVVKFWTINTEIAKLETLLATAISENDENEQISLKEKLNNTRMDKKKFIEDRRCVPSPILFYSKALDLSRLIEDPDFTVTIEKLWNKAVC